MNNMSNNTLGIRMVAFDCLMDYLIYSRITSPVDGGYAKFGVRMPALVALWSAVNSGEDVPESLVDAAVECVEKFNELQIDYSAMPEFMKAEKKMQEQQYGESVKFALKSILKSQGRLV